MPMLLVRHPGQGRERRRKNRQTSRFVWSHDFSGRVHGCANAKTVAWGRRDGGPIVHTIRAHRHGMGIGIAWHVIGTCLCTLLAEYHYSPESLCCPSPASWRRQKKQKKASLPFSRGNPSSAGPAQPLRLNPVRAAGCRIPEDAEVSHPGRGRGKKDREREREMNRPRFLLHLREARGGGGREGGGTLCLAVTVSDSTASSCGCILVGTTTH